jgi:hypothetical protein
MKAIFLKRFIPVLLFGMAIVGAFATNINQESSSSVSHVQGFVKLNSLGTTCDTPEMCSTDFGVICTVGDIPEGTQLWGKNSNDRCVVELYRITQ